ncbi:MAG TPA: hypothetical protein VF190_11920 [Rhodothermales bacterium]
MEIVDVEIAPESPAHVTPLELLEDFADVVPDWHFLEEDSRLYAAIRGSEACVIRSWNSANAAAVDYAFAASPTDPLTMRLVVLCPPDAMEPVLGTGRSTCLERFLDDFNRYAEARHAHVHIRPIHSHTGPAVVA